MPEDRRREVNGLFTGESLRVWRNGAFKGSCMDFRAGRPAAFEG